MSFATDILPLSNTEKKKCRTMKHYDIGVLTLFDG